MGNQNRLRKTILQNTRLSASQRILIFSCVLFIVAFLVVLIYTNLGTAKKSFAGLGMHGTKTVSTTNVVLNEFTTLTANASGGASSITVASSSLNSNNRFTGSLAAGELIMIIQMQGASMTTSSSTSSTWGAVSGYNNAGKFEFDEVADVPDGTTINLVSPLRNTYTSSGKVQVVRVPRYTSFNLVAGASVTTDTWNGSTGGIVAIESDGVTTINGTIDANSKGFRGGSVQQNSTCCTHGSNSSTYATTSSSAAAEKGEGIGGSVTTYDGLGGRYGRGAPANGGGGGNSHNAAGGGGSNGNSGGTWNGFGNPDTITVSNWKTAWDLDGAVTTFHKNTSPGGGRGGYTYSSSNQSALSKSPGSSNWGGDYRANVGGLGGRPLDNSGYRIYFGGGGGSGDSNNGTGTGGANGGGIVFLLSGGAVSGSGTINANGADAATATGTSTDGDGAGGGGGGGTVVVYSRGATISNLTINANGGKGGDQNIGFSEAEGAGGGGGGGYIAVTNATSLNRNVTGGNNGTTNSPSLTEFLPNGATRGASGLTVLAPSNPYSGTVTLPVTLKSFSGEMKNSIVDLNWVTESEINNDHFTVERSADGYDYYEIGRVAGAGNSTMENSYKQIDESPLKGDAYYRLSQTDFDGKTTRYSPIHLNFFSSEHHFNISYFSPNPFDDHLIVEYYSPESGITEIQLVTAEGILVRSENIVSSRGQNSFYFDQIADLKKGVYLVQLIQSDKKTAPVKVVKK